MGGAAGGEAVPEAARRLAGDPMHGGMKEDPGQFAVPEPLVEAFEPLEFVHHGVGHEPEHPLLLKATFEAAHRFRMGPGFLRPLRRGLLGTEQQRADEFIPILRGIEKRQLGVVRIGMGPHW